jgi:hypothetical protein
MIRIVSAALGLSLIAAPALAQTQTAPAPAPAPSGQAAAPAVGAVVYDPQGTQVGTIESLVQGGAVVNMGTTKVTLPLTAIGPGANGLTTTLSKAELEAAGAKAQADAQAQLKTALTPGAQVYGSAGSPVGTVKSSDATTVTLTTPQGDAALPMTGFAMGPNGPFIGMTAEQLNAAIAAAKPKG